MKRGAGPTGISATTFNAAGSTPRNQIAVRRGDPHRSCAHHRHERTLGQLHRSGDLVEHRINPQQPAIAVGDHPDGAFTRGDTPLAVTDRRWYVKFELAGLLADAIEPLVRATRRPYRTEADGDARARTAPDRNGLRHAIGGRID